jgi:hypothetical protein
MYTEGNILYFTPFYFKNGNTAKPKYLVVLKTIGDKTILASLPTRTDSIPAKDVVEAGCVELPDINLNCFVISHTLPITVCNKKLDFPTFIYGHELDTYELKDLRDIYRIEGSDYNIYGKMKPEIFKDLISCLKTSKSVKQKHIKELIK